MRILQPESSGLLVHHLHARVRRTADELGHRVGGVVGRMDDDRLHHLFEREGLAHFEVNLRTTHFRRGCRCGHLIGQLQAAVGNLLRDEQHEHHLGQRRCGPWLIHVVVEDHGAGGGLHRAGGRVRAGEGIRLMGAAGRGRSAFARPAMVAAGRGCNQKRRREDRAGSNYESGAQQRAPTDASNWIHHPLPPHLIPAIYSPFLGRETRARGPRSIRDLKLLEFPDRRD